MRQHTQICRDSTHARQKFRYKSRLKSKPPELQAICSWSLWDRENSFVCWVSLDISAILLGKHPTVVGHTNNSSYILEGHFISVCFVLSSFVFICCCSLWFSFFEKDRQGQKTWTCVCRVAEEIWGNLGKGNHNLI